MQYAKLRRRPVCFFAATRRHPPMNPPTATRPPTLLCSAQVLDARDPNGTRCRHLEQHLKKNARHKHLLLLLNKCDLVSAKGGRPAFLGVMVMAAAVLADASQQALPPLSDSTHPPSHLPPLASPPAQVPAWVTKRWLHTLSREYPTLAFHASITNPFGKGSLLSLLRQLARLRTDKQYISVGLVGYPNVGKSSVINTLRSKKVRGGGWQSRVASKVVVEGGVAGLRMGG